MHVLNLLILFVCLLFSGANETVSVGLGFGIMVSSYQYNCHCVLFGNYGVH